MKDNREVIDLSGPDGNAFVILGYAKEYANQLDLDFSAINKEMTSGDYKFLLNTFEKYFGEYARFVN